MKENILILVNSFISCSKKQYFKTQLINTEHRTQNTDTEHRTQTQLISSLLNLYLNEQTCLRTVRLNAINLSSLLFV